MVLGSYQASQDRLLQDTSNFDQARHQLISCIEQYKEQQNREEQIAANYASRQSHIEGLRNQLNDYSSSAQRQLDSYAHDVKWRAEKLQKSASITGLVQGAGIGALTFGAGMGIGGLGGTGAGAAGSVLGQIGFGVKCLTPLLGIGHYMNTSNIIPFPYYN